jgi:acyl carrier protein
MDAIKNNIRSFILSEYLPGESPANLKDDTPLRTSGVLDSVATLALVSFLEEQYHIEIEAHETGIESFDRLADIASMVQRKLGAGA